MTFNGLVFHRKSAFLSHLLFGRNNSGKEGSWYRTGISISQGAHLNVNVSHSSGMLPMPRTLIIDIIRDNDDDHHDDHSSHYDDDDDDCDDDDDDGDGDDDDDDGDDDDDDDDGDDDDDDDYEDEDED
jgi:hypothetical protein